MYGRLKRLLLPEIIVISVVHIISPRRDVAVKILLVYVRKNAEPQIPFIRIGNIEFEIRIFLL